MSLHILALYAHVHTVSSKKGPGLGLRPGLHAKGGIPLGFSSEQKETPWTGKTGLQPKSSAPQREARDPLGTPTEQQGPQHPHSTPVAHSRKASITHWTLVLTNPHGSAP